MGYVVGIATVVIDDGRGVIDVAVDDSRRSTVRVEGEMTRRIVPQR